MKSLNYVKPISQNLEYTLQLTNDTNMKSILWITFSTILKSTKRIILLKDGKVIGDGSPNACLTPKKISSLFETPLLVSNNNGYWQIFPAL